MKAKCSFCLIIFDRAANKISKALKANHSLYCSEECKKEGQRQKRKTRVESSKAFASKSYRKKALSYYGCICQKPGCGYSVKEVLQVHHKDEDRSNNSLSNLMVLCPTHHMEIHKNIWNIKK